jgi:hypothetical protein
VFNKVPFFHNNTNNNIHFAVSGKDCIMVIVPDNKILSNILLVYKYLLKAKLPANIVKTLPPGKYKYSSMTKDLDTIKVQIVGKCKTFIGNLKDESPKIDNFLKNITTISSVDRDDIEGGGKPNEESLKLNGLSQTALLYFTILSANIPSKISKNEIKLNCASACRLKDLFAHKSSFQERVKSFLQQAGTVGTPSAKDKDKSNWNAKKDMIRKTLDAICGILGDVHGVKLPDLEINKLKVDGNAIAEVKQLKF